MENPSSSTVADLFTAFVRERRYIKGVSSQNRGLVPAIVESFRSNYPIDDSAGSDSDNQTVLPVYTLTCICSVEYIKKVESVFEIIAEPNRRAILSLLVSSQQSVGEIERQLRMPQPTVSKHLRVLREAGFVESMVDAQRRLYRLKPEPLQEVDVWLAPFRRFWSAHLDALERHLDRMGHAKEDQSTPTKRKTRRRRRGPHRERNIGEMK